MKQPIFKGHHFKSLKEWKRRKKGLWLCVLPKFEVLLTPKEILEHIKTTRIMLTQDPEPLPTATYIGIKRNKQKKSYAEKFTKPPFRYKFGYTPLRPRKPMVARRRQYPT